MADPKLYESEYISENMQVDITYRSDHQVRVFKNVASIREYQDRIWLRCTESSGDIFKEVHKDKIIGMKIRP